MYYRENINSKQYEKYVFFIKTMELIFLVWRMLSLTKAWVKIRRTENISSVKFSHREVAFASPSLFPED